MDWPRLIVGLGVGVIALGVYEFMLIAALRLLGAGPAEFHRARRELSRHRPGVYRGYLVVGVAAGLAAGLLPSWWPDIGLAAAVVVLNVLLPLALLPTVRRRMTERAERQPAATGSG